MDPTREGIGDNLMLYVRGDAMRVLEARAVYEETRKHCS